jgi:hypothetical protein
MEMVVAAEMVMAVTVMTAVLLTIAHVAVTPPLTAQLLPVIPYWIGKATTIFPQLLANTFALITITTLQTLPYTALL